MVSRSRASTVSTCASSGSTRACSWAVWRAAWSRASWAVSPPRPSSSPPLLTIPAFASNREGVADTKSIFIYGASVLVAFFVSMFLIIISDYRTKEERAEQRGP